MNEPTEYKLMPFPPTKEMQVAGGEYCMHGETQALSVYQAMWQAEPTKTGGENNPELPTFKFYKSEVQTVLRIDLKGRLFWKEREVDTDNDLRAAMLEVRDLLIQAMKVKP